MVSVGRRGQKRIKKIPAVSLKPPELIDLLKNMKVGLLICGGIKEECQQVLRSNNIEFIENVIGNIDDVVKSCLNGKLRADVVIHSP